jgi:hypothetical protein
MIGYIYKKKIKRRRREREREMNVCFECEKKREKKRDNFIIFYSFGE